MMSMLAVTMMWQHYKFLKRSKTLIIHPSDLNLQFEILITCYDVKFKTSHVLNNQSNQYCNKVFD